MPGTASIFASSPELLTQLLDLEVWNGGEFGHSSGLANFLGHFLDISAFALIHPI